MLLSSRGVRGEAELRSQLLVGRREDREFLRVDETVLLERRRGLRAARARDSVFVS